MHYRAIKQKVSGIQTSDGAGVSLKRIIGQPALRNLDPFLMLDEFGSDQPDDYLAGFPNHPHRGFQTVTYMLQGKMAHADSAGNEGLIESGGIQWMNAGSGIIHSEMPRQTEGLLRGFQLWVNLPASEKMSSPGYQDIAPEDVPVLEKGELQVKVLAGEFEGVAGPVKNVAVEPLFLDVRSVGAATLAMPLLTMLNAFVYCFEGQAELAGKILQKGELAVLDTGNTLKIALKSDSACIIVAARPIEEPIVQYGPFVMNSEAEIRQALMDYQQGRLVRSVT
ncbi:pirin family protein [Pseudobowmanella zhangzhouensis]|uniref:pirin family protein n=1 Tax=Pseudobowmanella zhangzhouensis TaxID=1537679 RepID=UPI00360FAC40